MSTSSNDRRRGSQPVETDNEQNPAAITKADQMAWEAPELRTIFLELDDGPRDLVSECPDWCDREGLGHDPDRVFEEQREHQGARFRVRQDRSNYFDRGSEGAEATAGHLELTLVLHERGVVPRVHIAQRWGSRGDVCSHAVGSFYFDEVRELIAVLQHLLKVGQES